MEYGIGLISNENKIYIVTVVLYLQLVTTDDVQLFMTGRYKKKKKK
jgi:hypothetical protein